MDKIIVGLFISGLLLGWGPCLATCGPVLISYIAATKQSPGQGVWAWFLFSLSRICVYLILSLAIFLLGEFVVKQNLINIAKFIYLAGGLIIILIGFFTIIRGSIKPFRNLENRGAVCRRSSMQPITLGLIMGTLPCGPLIAVFSYIGLVSSTWQLCIFYSLIFGLSTLISPLILFVLVAGLIPRMLLSQPKIYYPFRLICGLIIVFFGAQLIFHGTG